MTDPSAVAPSVLIDASSLSSVAASSGIGTYVRNLVAGLVAAPDPRLVVRALATPDAPLDAGAHRALIHRRIRSRPRAEVIEHAVLLPLDLVRHRHAGEVFHSPGFHAPWGVGRPWVQTLHDVIPLVVDEPDLAALRQRWRRFGPRYRQADAVIAVSHHAASEGIRLLGLDPGRVHVAPHGVGASFTPDGGPPADPPYLLVVSAYSRRKGFAEAFAVVDALAGAGYPHRLKVAGPVHPSVAADLARLRSQAGSPDRIEVLGFVPDLAELYRRATAVIVPSRYEGFGLPAVEAMACGAPVVAFSNSAITEVVEGGGSLVPDGDVGAMVGAVRTLLDSPAAADEWRERGLARVAGMTWDRSAALHSEVYRQVAEAFG